MSPFTAAETTRVGSSSWHRWSWPSLSSRLPRPPRSGKLLVANRPDDNGRRVPIALYHVFELCKTFRIRTHLPRLAHHRHSQAIHASTHSGVGMLCEVRTELHPIDLSTPIRYACRRSGAHSHTGMIWMVQVPWIFIGLPFRKKPFPHRTWRFESRSLCARRLEA